MAGLILRLSVKKQVDFTDSYYDNSAVFITVVTGKISDVASLKGKQIGVQNGTTHQKFINEQHKKR